MEAGQGVFRLKGVVQHYSWGGYDYIPQLLGQQNESRQPSAELWLGAHPNHPSLVVMHEGSIPLHQFLDKGGPAVLGTATAQQFGRLPYLLKVLDVRQMLSIQVHPDIASAKRGFQLENEQGIAPNAPNRNYKDDNHKPELMVALSDFWLLHGFKSPALLKAALEMVPELQFLSQTFEQGGYKALYEQVMTMPQPEVNALLQPVIDRILPLYHNGELLKEQEEFWAARAAETYCTNGNIDRGIFSIFLFNLVYLRKGEGIYQPAQLPHAYLEGQNVELMANSDNVLRAGLTDKYIDVLELLKHVRYEETIPIVLGADASEEEVIHFSVPASEFELYQYNLAHQPVSIQSAGAEILLALAGSTELEQGPTKLTLQKGEAAFISAQTAYTLSGAPQALVFRAAVPQKQPLS